MRGIFERVIALLLVALAGCGKDPAAPVILQPVAPVILQEGVVIASPDDIAALRARGGAAYIIDGDLQIAGTSLTALTGLEGLRRVEGSVEVWFNDRLESLAGLEGLESVGAGLGPAEAAGKAAHVVEGLLIFENKALRSLKGLERLAAVRGGLALVRNEALASLTDLSHLVAIEGSVDIWFNDALLSLEGLHYLARVRDFLEVSGNGALQSLNGLRGVRHVGADLIISNNARLPQSAVRAFAERMVAEGFTGAVIAEGNLGAESPGP